MWEGSSGSPVFVEDAESNSFSFIGVISDYALADRVIKRTDGEKNIRFQENISLGHAIKGDQLFPMLQQTPLPMPESEK